MSRRLGILAGRGELVADVVQAALAAGDTVRVFAFAPQADLAGVDVVAASTADPAGLFAGLAAFAATHVTLVGGVDLDAASRRGLSSLAGGPDRIGDVDIALSVRAHLERLGVEVVGAHEVAPGLLAGQGRLAGPAASDAVLAAARHSLAVARAVGRIDLGQAAIASASRAVGAEDIGGTDALLERFQAYRAAGLVAPRDEVLVLAKAKKPQQPDYVDLPAIGPRTVRGAHAAGLAAIAVEAGRTLVAGRSELLGIAAELELPVIGLSIDE